MEADDFKKIEDTFKHHVGIMTEDFQQKLDIVVEGPQMLSEKIDRVEATLGTRIDKVETKVDAMATDLSTHRADTEAHHGVYRVRESGE